jgi:hypothetical protein
VDEPARVKDIIKSTALLEQKIVEQASARLPASGRAQPIRWDSPGREGAASVSQKIQRASAGRRMVFANKVAAITGGFRTAVKAAASSGNQESALI